MIKSRMKQYFNLLLIAIVLGTMVCPIQNVNATTYTVDVDETNNQIYEGMKLYPSDRLQISSNQHTNIYSFPYGYNGEYTSEKANNSIFSMSGQTASLYTSQLNRMLEVKKFDSNGDVFIQEIDAININDIENQNVVKGNKATFSVNFSVKNVPDSILKYTWFVTNSNNETQEIPNSNSRILEINPTDTNLYVNGSKFSCLIYEEDHYAVNLTTNKALLSISDGYSLTYKSTDGTETYKTASEKYSAGNLVSLDYKNVPIKDGRKFVGWSTLKNSKVAYYKTTSDKLVMPAANTVLYAVWNENKLVDEPTNIVLEGTFSYGTNLKVEKLEKDNTDDSLIKLLDKSKNLIGSYNIMIQNGNYEGKMNLMFSVGEQYNDKEITVYHKLASGKIEIKIATVKNGKLNIIVDQLSPFMLTENKEITNPNTIDNINIYIMSGIVSLIGIGLILNKKIRLN